MWRSLLKTRISAYFVQIDDVCIEIIDDSVKDPWAGLQASKCCFLLPFCSLADADIMKRKAAAYLEKGG